MPVISGVGAGSGLDINSLVSQLVAAERSAPSAAINRREARAKAQISSIGTIKGAFSSLQSALNGLKASSLFSGRTITSTESSFVNAKSTAAGGASPGSFEVVVDRLAQAQKLRTAQFSTADAGNLAQGTLQFQYGAGENDKFSVTITDSNNTLRQLATEINQQANGKGVSASVIASESGETLVLTAVKSGANNAITVTQTGGAGDLSAFLNANLVEETVAQDARAFIDGIEVTGSSNTLTDVVAGVELQLLKLTTGTDGNPSRAKITVTDNAASAKTAIKAFVTAYNGVTSAIATATAFDIENKTSAALNGDALTRGADAQLRTNYQKFIAEVGDAGLNLGISSDATGKLSFDEGKFDAAFLANPVAVRGLFDGENGALFRNLSPQVEGLLAPEGSFAQRTSSLDSQLKSAARQREALDLRLEQVEARFRRQFVALDALIGQLGQTSNFLSQQLANLPSVSNNK